MSDTQWPRFQVFHQARPGQPHQNAGTVHAPDIELAILNARDVFARRPDCVSLWVVPADQIRAMTLEELERGQLETAAPEGGEARPFLVFIKPDHKRTHQFAGQISAASSDEALRLAVESTREKHPVVWWVCPAEAVLRSEPEEEGSFFEPASEKPYRNPGFYHTDTLMRQIRRQRDVSE